MRKKWRYRFLFMVITSLVLFSCSKKGFIDEGQLGNGIHYYPLILNKQLYDTVSNKYLNETDATFTPGQTLVFELDYFSQDSVSHIELWAGKSRNSLQKVKSIPYESSFHSRSKGLDTTLISYTLSTGPDSSATKWFIVPKVVTLQSLQATFDATISVVH